MSTIDTPFSLWCWFKAYLDTYLWKCTKLNGTWAKKKSSPLWCEQLSVFDIIVVFVIYRSSLLPQPGQYLSETRPKKCPQYGHRLKINPKMNVRTATAKPIYPKTARFVIDVMTMQTAISRKPTIRIYLHVFSLILSPRIIIFSDFRYLDYLHIIISNCLMQGI